MLFGFVVIDNWDTELKEMNEDIIREPFHFPNTYLLLLGYAEVYFHIQYRQTNKELQENAYRKVPSLPTKSN